MVMKLLIHTFSLNLPRNERTETQKPTAFALCSGLPSILLWSDADVGDLRLCVLELYLIYCILLLIHFRGFRLFRSCSVVVLFVLFGGFVDFLY